MGQTATKSAKKPSKSQRNPEFVRQIQISPLGRRLQRAGPKPPNRESNKTNTPKTSKQNQHAGSERTSARRRGTVARRAWEAATHGSDRVRFGRLSCDPMSASSLGPRFMPPCTGLHPAPPPPHPPLPSPPPRARAESSLEHGRSPPAADLTPKHTAAGSAGRSHPPEPRSSAGRRAGTARGGAERGRRAGANRQSRREEGKGGARRQAESENETKGNGSGSRNGLGKGREGFSLPLMSKKPIAGSQTPLRPSDPR